MDAIELENTPPDNLTFVAAQMISIVSGERARQQRIEQWNARKNQKNS